MSKAAPVIDADQIEQCLLSDRDNLRNILKAIERNVKADKPCDRLQARFEQQLSTSRALVAKRQQAPLSIAYDDALPICDKRDDILKLIAENQVIVLAGETGSGKTTQLPKLCLELGRGIFGMIGHTQPRRLAARAVASRIAEELQVEVGSTVGFQVRFSDQLAEHSRVKLMTDGILLAEIQNDPLLLKYDTLIIDEAHERSLNIDFLLGYLKRILPQRPDLKLIITSATIDLQRFSQHFNNAPVIEVSGRTYPVELIYRPLHEGAEDDDRDLDLQQAIVNAVREIEDWEQSAGASARNGDVLVFLSGERDIRETAEALRKQQLRNTEVLPLYARLSNAEQNKIFHPSGRGRRIVLATNVAETSLTVPGIRYVIDPGFARISRYSYRAKVQRLPIEAVSQASANQRKGRCGRVAEGICIRLYSEEDFNSRPQFTDAEILRTNLAAVILQMEGLKLGRVEDFPFIDPPDSRFVKDGVNLLQELRAFDERGKLTNVGRQLSRLPVDPRIGRMLVEAARNQCLTEVLVIASALSIQDPRERPLDKQQQADQKHREHADPDSDFIGFLNLWNQYEEQRQELSAGKLRNYCKKQFLSFMRMREWRDLHRQLHLACRDVGLKENANPAGSDAIHRSLLAGLLGQIGLRQEEGDYLGARNRRFMIFPGSVLAKKRQPKDKTKQSAASASAKKSGPPKWMMAAELVETSRVFARIVARIDPRWVEPLAQHLIKRSYSEPHWERRPAQVVAFEQQNLYGLPIVTKRKVHYGAVEPDEAQQIFIRSALVEGDFQTKAAFFEHNRNLLEEVAALEDKSRRRDILIDEQQLYDFYREQLIRRQGDDVVNGASFEQWCKKVEAKDPQALFVTREQLMQHDAQAVNAQQYPDYLEWQGMRFPLHYHFSPGAKDDGVTLTVPVGALAALPKARLEWLVPGMLKEKVTALLKGLPKQLRKNFVPVPDYVDAFIEGVDAASMNESLTAALSDALRRMTGVRLEPDVWQQVDIDKHHLINIDVLDEEGKPLVQGRDWEALVEQFADRVSQPQPKQSHAIERDNVKAWDFGDLPESVTLKQAGMEVTAYPAVTVLDSKASDKQQTQALTQHLAVRLHDSKAAALHAHDTGVVELLCADFTSQLKDLKRSLAGWHKCELLFAPLGSGDLLWQDFCRALVKRSCFKSDKEPLPRTAAEYQLLLQLGRSVLYENAEALLHHLEIILIKRKQVAKALTGNIRLDTATVLSDIKRQVESLVYPGFMAATPPQWWVRLPVYLDGIAMRLEKYQRDLNQQRFHSELLQSLWSQYSTGKDKPGMDSAVAVEFRWMLEEFRISLFAQQLGTLAPVSEKRLQKLWRSGLGP